MDWLWSDKNCGYILISEALQRVSQTKVVTKAQRGPKLASGTDVTVYSSQVALALYTAAVSTPAPRTAHWFCQRGRQTERLMTVLASGSRERNWHVSGGEWGRDGAEGGEGGERFSVCASVDASRGGVCGVSSWQLSSYTTCLPGKERGKPLLSSLLLSSFQNSLTLAAWCCCHGVGVFW